MKKRNLKSLQLNKKSISKLQQNKNHGGIGGNTIGLLTCKYIVCPTNAETRCNCPAPNTHRCTDASACCIYV